MIASDTIVAIATPPGNGGIGIVRLSGPDAFPIASQLFRGDLESHRMRHGQIVDEAGAPVDDVVVLPYCAPNSYTGEDVIEFCCHGGSLTLAAVVRLCLAQGARPAEPGEFTKRAFLNGKLDLAQAEAVCDLIVAGAEAQRRLALRQIEGELSRCVGEVRDRLMSVLAAAEAAVDFSEEVGELDTVAARANLDQALKTVDELLAGFAQGRLVREGAVVAIVGLPNVGKSSLLNALVGTERAIVTSVPGTTRDTIEDQINLEGVPVTLVDTAGLRETSDVVEEIGVRRTREAVSSADLVMLLLSPDDWETPSNDELLDRMPLVVLNKADIAGEETMSAVRQRFPGMVEVSATQRTGLDQLRHELRRRLLGDVPVESALVSRERHQHALLEARGAIAHGNETLSVDVPTDFLCIDLRGALDALGLVTGETATADIVERIFSDFCIGK